MKYLIISLSIFLSFFLSWNLAAQCGTLSFGDIQSEENGFFSVDVFLDEPQLFEFLEVEVRFFSTTGSVNQIEVDATQSQGASGILVTNGSSSTRANIRGSISTPLVNSYLATVFFEMEFQECLASVEFGSTPSYFYSTQAGGCGSADISTIEIDDEYCTPDRRIGGLSESPIFGNHINDVDIYVDYSAARPPLAFINEPSYYDIDIPTTNVEVSAEKDDDPTCGVSTVDLIAIQQALLGIASFTYPSQLIAADVNNDEQVTTIDMIRIRKVILDQSSVGESFYQFWEFIPTNVYYNISLPFNQLSVPLYTNEYGLPVGETNIPGLGFVGVKIGDVNDNCDSGGARPSPLSDNKSIALTVPQQHLEQGTQTLLPVYASQFNNETFLSLSFSSAGDQLQFLDIIPASLKDIDGTAFRINRDLNALELIWFPYDNQAQSLSNNEPLFYLKVAVQTDIRNIAEVLFLSNDNNFKHNKYGQEVSLRLLTTGSTPFTSRDNKMTTGIYPNPVSSTYQLSFMTTFAQTTTIELFDSSGKQVYQQTLFADKGMNILQISALATLPSGIYYQRLSTEEETTTSKIVNQ